MDMLRELRALTRKPMRLTLRTNLAMRTLMHCAVRFPESLRTADVARACNASFHHVAQVVNKLESEGFLNTARGRGGGISLAMASDDISVGKVVRLFEGDMPFAECMNADRNTCPLTDTCRLRNYIARAVEAFYHELDMVTLSDLVKGNCGLEQLLGMSRSLAAECGERA